MSGKQAKRLRKEIYGADYSPRFRSYTRPVIKGEQAPWIVADEKRQEYQRAKKRNRTS